MNTKKKLLLKKNQSSILIYLVCVETITIMKESEIGKERNIKDKQ
jgi:hypothetical protein